MPPAPLRAEPLEPRDVPAYTYTPFVGSGLAIPTGIAADSAGVYVTTENQLSLFDFRRYLVQVNGAGAATDFIDITGAGATQYLYPHEGGNGRGYLMLADGRFFAYNFRTGTTSLLFNVKTLAVSINTTQIYDANTGLTGALSGVLPRATQTQYGDFAVVPRANGQRDLIVSGYSIAQPFVLRVRMTSADVPVSARVLLSSSVSTAPEFNAPRGLAARADGTVVTTMPIFRNILSNTDAPFALSADFPETGAVRPFLLFPAAVAGGMSVVSTGGATDPAGNFYLTVSGSGATDLPGAAGVLTVSADLSRRSANPIPNSTLVTPRDVALSPDGARGYIPIIVPNLVPPIGGALQYIDGVVSFGIPANEFPPVAGGEGGGAGGPAGRPIVVGGAPDGTVRLVTAGANTPVAPFGNTGAPTRTASADVNGDGVADVVAVTGPGTALRLAVLSGADGSVLVAPFDPFGGGFAGGGYVAAGDLDGDGLAEFVVTPDQGGGPRVTVFSLLNGAAATRVNFFGIDDATFRGGARAAVGDINGDGVPDLIVAAGFGGGPRAAVFDGRSVRAGNPTKLVNDFFAFPGADADSLRNGAFVAAGDVNGDGFADLVFGGGPGGAPRVFVLSGALVSAGNVGGAQAAPLANFFVNGDDSDRGGARVAVTNADGDGKADVAVGSGAGRPARVRVYLGAAVGAGGEPAGALDLDPFGGAVLADGVFVG